MKKYVYTFLAIAFMLASCSKDTDLNPQVNTVTAIGASSEAVTRTTIDPTDNTKVIWSENDRIGVLGTNSSSTARNLAYNIESGVQTTAAKFINAESDITSVSAVMYPYQSDAEYSGSTLTVEIPSVQTGSVGSFDKNAAIMYSLGSEINVNLISAVNYLRVNVTENNVHSITISSDIALSGTMEITSSGINAAAKGAMNSVTLVASGTNQCLASGYYYIAVKAGNISSPKISYVYYNGNTATVKTKTGSTTISFAEGKNVKNISVTNWDGSEQSSAVQLWSDGPYFANTNIDGYYAWGGCQNKVDDHYTGNTDLSGYYDTASRLLGTGWRLPTKAEMQSLLDNCTMQWNEQEQTMSFTSQGTVLNLPALGYWHSGSVSNVGTSGNYMTSTYCAYYLGFNKNTVDKGVYSPNPSGFGFSVRAVLR